MNNIISKLLGTAAVVAVATFFVGATHETMVLKGEVDEISIGTIVNELTDDNPLLRPFMQRTLIIDSPGGSVSELNFLQTVEMQAGGRLTTMTNNMAASAASTIFLMGDERLVGPDADIIFHEIRMFAGNLALTFSDLKSVYEHNKLAPNSSLVGKRLSTGNELAILLGVEPKTREDHKTIVDDIKEMFGEDLKLVVESMEKMHNKHIQYLMNRLNVSKSYITKNLLVTNTDIHIDAKKALETGIATGRM